MAFIPALNTVQVEITATKDGLPVENVFNFNKTSAWQAAELETLVNATITYWDNNAPPLLPSDTTLNKVVATDLTIQLGAQHEDNFDPGTVGTRNGIAEPNNVSKLISLNTGFRGRSARGGIHWMGFSKDDIAVNTISSVLINSILIFLANYKAFILDETGANMVVVSRETNKVKRSAAAMFVVDTFTVAHNRSGSMRGRLT